MATASDGSKLITFGNRMLVGRCRDCHITLEDPSVSGEHAMLAWSPRGWDLRDLGSRNGTFLNQRRLPPGQRSPLAEGDELRFGAAPAWIVADLRPPLARAHTLEGNVEEEELDGVIAFQDGSVVAAHLALESGRWWLQLEDGSQQECIDQQVITVASTAWRLELPPPGLGAVDTTFDAAPVALAGATLRWQVSVDGEHASMTLESPGGRQIQFPSRAHHHVLLALAQTRLRERQTGIPEGECGWIYVDELGANLKLDRTRLNLEFFRARKALHQHGVLDAEHLVERRLDTKQVRIGVEALEILGA